MTVARGLAILAALLSMVVAGQELVEAQPPSGEPPKPVCRGPVEVFRGGIAELGCLGSPGLRACPDIEAGDRVALSGGACVAERGGMSAAWRLATGLPIRLNFASIEELQLIRGIGPALASAIVEYRETEGAFRSLVEVERVPGVGPKTLARVAQFLTVR